MAFKKNITHDMNDAAGITVLCSRDPSVHFIIAIYCTLNHSTPNIMMKVKMRSKVARSLCF